MSLPVSHDNVLRLKIAMHQNARQPIEMLRDLVQRRQRSERSKLYAVDGKIAAETVFEKVILFPNVKLCVELRRQILLDFDAGRLRQTMERGNLIERRFVKRAAHQPALRAIAEKIALAQVLNPDQTFCRVVKINFRHSNSACVKKSGDLDVVLIFFPLQIVLNQN